MSAVTLERIRKSFGPLEVISGVDLDIAHGEFVVFVGPSGSGKSTMLRMLAGLEEVTSGVISIGGQDVTWESPSERGIAMVFQSYALYPHMDVFENIAFNLRLKKTAKAEVNARVREAARILKLTELLDRKPGQLSGGQRQRVAIGRAIVRNPDVFLFDEPLSNLDAALRVEMRFEIERLHRELGATMVYVTHDQVEAMTLADRIVAFDGGKIQQVGTPLELYKNPSNLFVAGFIGSPQMNFIDAVVDEKGVVTAALDDKRIIDLPGREIGISTSLTLGIRPEAITIRPLGQQPEGQQGDDQLVVKGRVLTVEHLGNVSFVHIQIGDASPLVVQASAEESLQAGEDIHADIPLSKLHVFDDTGNAIAKT